MFGNEKTSQTPTENSNKVNEMNESVNVKPAAGAGASNQKTSTTSATGYLSTENVKRKKTKSRNAAVPNATLNYPKDHLDAWLETCVKDSNTAQLSSSSEFLDFNPNIVNSSNRHSQSMQMQPKQYFNPNQTLPQTHQFYNRPSTSYPVSFSQSYQKNVPNYISSNFNSKFLNNSLSFMQNDDCSVEFASLPPVVNMMGSEIENQSTNVLSDCSNQNNIRGGFRFSDPCLINPDNESKISGQNTPNKRNFNNANGDGDENNKFFKALMQQINLLHETNSKICRNLHETKVDIEALKHAPNWGIRHRRDSISGLSTHSQPLGAFGYGTQSPAPTYHSGAYTPGMMTDIVREVKEAARVREDALLSRVKSLVEERTWSQGEGNLRMMRDIEELKTQVHSLRSDRKETNKRITQLETENKYMRQMIGSLLNNRSNENVVYRSTPLHKNVQSNEMLQQKRHSLSLNYGVINHEDGMSALHITETSKLDNHSQHNSNSDASLLRQQNGSFVPSDNEEENQNQMEKETIKLRRELQEALATRSQAENRIIALEHMVKKLHGINVSTEEQRNNIGYNHNVSEGGIGHYFNNQSSISGHISQNQLSNPNQINLSQQMQGQTSKLSLAGPITDL